MKNFMGYNTAKNIFAVLGCCLFLVSCSALDERLIGAINKGNVVKINEIIDEGIDVNAKGIGANTALIEAAITGRNNVVKALLDAGADVNAKGENDTTPLMVAVFLGRVDMVRILLDAGADIEAKSESTPLMMGVILGRVDMVRTLLDAGADINAKGADEATPLMIAVLFGRVDMVRILLDAGADINAKNQNGATPLMVACLSGNVLNAMLNEIPHILSKARGSRADMMADASLGRVDTIKMLLDAGSDVNARNNDGLTPLMLITTSGNFKVFRVLLDAGADISAQNDVGFTSLVYASMLGHTKVVKMLLDVGADVDVRSKGGGNALIFAAMFRHTDIVQALLDAGADVNAQDNADFTPLMSSVATGLQDPIIKLYAELGVSLRAKPRSEVVKILIDAGANVNLKNNKGKTALDYEKASEKKSLIKKYEQERNHDLEKKVMATCSEIKVNTSLPHEVYADRKILEANLQLSDERYFVAAKIMEFVRCYSVTNNIILPTEFHFENAEVLILAGLNNAAKAEITRYLKEVGRKGKNYQNALQVLNGLEQK